MNWKRWIPVRQKTKYTDSQGKKMICEWRMFLTKAFDIHYYEV